MDDIRGPTDYSDGLGFHRSPLVLPVLQGRGRLASGVTKAGASCCGDLDLRVRKDREADRPLYSISS